MDGYQLYFTLKIYTDNLVIYQKDMSKCGHIQVLSTDYQSWNGWFPPLELWPTSGDLTSSHFRTQVLHITFIFDRCRRSSAAVASVKYKCDSNNLRGSFGRSKILLTEKLTNGTLVTPTPVQVTSPIVTSLMFPGAVFANTNVPHL